METHYIVATKYFIAVQFSEIVPCHEISYNIVSIKADVIFLIDKAQNRPSIDKTILLGFIA